MLHVFVSQLSSALLFDAVHTVVAAVQELNRSQNVGATQLSCKSSKIWEHGTSLMNYLRMVRHTALHQALYSRWAHTLIIIHVTHSLQCTIIELEV